MESIYRFASTVVTCEGYDYPEDPYILKGSCGVEVAIDLTPEASRAQQQHGGGYGGNNPGGAYVYGPHGRGSYSSGGIGGPRGELVLCCSRGIPSVYPVQDVHSAFSGQCHTRLGRWQWIRRVWLSWWWWWWWLPTGVGRLPWHWLR
eukprot:Opistho-2@7778